MNCIITGCALIDGNRWVAGDLFEAGGCYIFNGNTEPNSRDACWLDWPPSYSKTVRFRAGANPFERKGVFVAPIGDWELNSAALAYVGD